MNQSYILINIDSGFTYFYSCNLTIRYCRINCYDYLPPPCESFFFHHDTFCPAPSNNVVVAAPSHSLHFSLLAYLHLPVVITVLFLPCRPIVSPYHLVILPFCCVTLVDCWFAVFIYLVSCPSVHVCVPPSCRWIVWSVVHPSVCAFRPLVIGSSTIGSSCCQSICACIQQFVRLATCPSVHSFCRSICLYVHSTLVNPHLCLWYPK